MYNEIAEYIMGDIFMRNFKFYTIVLAAITAVSLTGCGNDVPTQSNQTKTTAASEETTTEAPTEETTEAPTAEITEAPTESETTEPLTEETTEAVETADYKTAYLDLINSTEDSDKLTYDLIHIDDDNIPELVLGMNGYYVSLYTYADGIVHTLMDHWSYGAMGNAGYEYVPKMNSIRNYNTDYAGLVGFTSYCSITAEHTLEATAIIETRLYEDTNGDSIPQNEEYIPDYQVYFIDGEEISCDEAVAYDAGKYEFVGGELTLDEIKAELS